jgi:hypothetical protein
MAFMCQPTAHFRVFAKREVAGIDAAATPWVPAMIGRQWLGSWFVLAPPDDHV